MCGAGGKIGEERAGARDRGGARRHGARNGGRACSRCAGDRLFHLRIAEATGNGALVRSSSMLWEERAGPLYKQLEHHYDSPGAVELRRWPSTAPC